MLVFSLPFCASSSLFFFLGGTLLFPNLNTALAALAPAPTFGTGLAQPKTVCDECIAQYGFLPVTGPVTREECIETSC